MFNFSSSTFSRFFLCAKFCVFLLCPFGMSCKGQLPNHSASHVFPQNLQWMFLTWLSFRLSRACITLCSGFCAWKIRNNILKWFLIGWWGVFWPATHRTICRTAQFARNISIFFAKQCFYDNWFIMSMQNSSGLNEWQCTSHYTHNKMSSKNLTTTAITLHTDSYVYCLPNLKPGHWSYPVIYRFFLETL